jgi:hypothetical protein
MPARSYTMQIKRAGLGKADDTADRVLIERRSDGVFAWSGFMSTADKAIFTTGPGIFASHADAEASAIAWAQAHGITELTVETENA